MSVLGLARQPVGTPQTDIAADKHAVPWLREKVAAGVDARDGLGELCLIPHHVPEQLPEVGVAVDEQDSGAGVEPGRLSLGPAVPGIGRQVEAGLGCRP